MNDYRKIIESNPVLKKLYELASLRFGKDRVIIRHVVRREIVAAKRYAWDLFEAPSDDAPVETVTVDANLSRKMQIDDEVSVELAA
jgi:hypothetical protein